jgi:hypothetical protein
VTEILLNPVRLVEPPGTVDLARRLRVRVEWSAAPATVPGRTAARPGPFDRLYPSVVANPSAAATGGSARPIGLSGDGTRQAAVEDGTPAAVMRPAVPLTTVPNSKVYRLEVSEDGIYRLDGSWLGGAAPDLMNRPVSQLFIAANGVEIPIRVVDDGDGLVSGSDVIEFFGERVDEDPLDPDVWQQGDYTDERPYFLGVAEGTRLRMSTAVSGAPVSGFPQLTSFSDTVKLEENDLFLNSVSTDADDRWYDGPLLSHPLPSSGPTRDLLLSLPGVDAGGTASLRVRMLGQIIGGNLDGYHRTALKVNGTLVDEADWDGVIVFTQGVDNGAVTFPASMLTASTTVRVELPLDREVDGSPITKDLVAVNWVEVSYPRFFQVANDRLLFAIPNQDAEIVVTGLSSDEAAAYDITPSAGGVSAPRHLAGASVGGGGPYTLTFELAAADGIGPTRTIAISAANPLQPASSSLYAVDGDLAAGAADWLLIGADSLLDLSANSALSDLVELRDNQGWQTRVVGLGEVYDQFSYGLKDPQAIRDFIRWTLLHWDPAPTFVVLVGDASYDAKNNYGHATPRDLLPTFMASAVGSPILTYFSVDNDFASVLGTDHLPDVLLGRLPAHDLSEAEALFDKLVAYGALASGPAWTRRGFFISDEESGGFESTMRQVIDLYFERPENPGLFDPNGPCFSTGTCRNDPAGPGPIFSTASLQALIERHPATPISTLALTMNQWIRDGIDAGDVVSQFNGHGSFQRWGRQASIFEGKSFDPDDVDLLANGSMPTFMVNINCITGGFHADSPPGTASDRLYSLGEDFLVTPDKGAVGVLAPSHLTFISLLGVATNAIWDRLLGEDRDRLLGALNLSFRLAFDSIGATTDLRSFAFLADPATVLVLPDPEPPSAVQAVGGNAVVDLSWTPGADAVTFLVERSETGPGGPYTVVSPPAHTASTYSDTGVVNGQTYHYRVVGRDGEGMDSVRSNRNTDCPAGPDCVSATPLNPIPPLTPTGFAVSDTGQGGQLALSWDANPESDLDFYRLRYGSTSGVYTSQTTFGPGATDGLLGGLENGVPVYLVLEAVNTSGLSSPPTSEETATPLRILGVSPPRPITDLRVSRDGNDALLSWSRIEEDIYQRPTTVQDYRVYASQVGPLFPTDEAHRLATVPDGPDPGFRHLGGASGSGTRFYLVVCRDADGFDSASALGFPAPVTGLTVTWVAPDTLRLQWPAVTTDTDGNPLAVDHYEVYASDSPFSRADIPAMTPVRPSVLATTVDLLESEGNFFSVIAVDARGDLSPH